MIHKRRKRGNDIPHTDPVCGMEVSQKTAPAVSEYENKTYYFCAEICSREFEENPEMYIHQFKKAGRMKG